MPRRRRKKPKVANPNDIEEQLRIQRRDAAAKLQAQSPPLVSTPRTPPPRMGNLIYSESRNAYFPRGYNSEAMGKCDEESKQTAQQDGNKRIPNQWHVHRHFPLATGIYHHPWERRRIAWQWRAEKLLQQLSIEEFTPDELPITQERFGVPPWYRSFAALGRPDRRFRHLRRNRGNDGFVSVLSNLNYNSSTCSTVETSSTTMNTSVKALSEKGQSFLSAECSIRNADTSIILEVHCDDNIGFALEENIPDFAFQDFCHLVDLTVLLAGRSGRRQYSWCVCDVQYHGRVNEIFAPSEPLSVETWSNAIVISGHRNGQISLVDLRCGDICRIHGPDPQIGNVVRLHVLSNKSGLVAQSAEGSCRLFDVRRNSVLQTIRPPAQPSWMRSADSLCRGMAVDPTQSVLLLPHPQNDATPGVMSIGLWSLLTGEYVGSKGDIETNYIELSPTIHEAGFSFREREKQKQGLLAVWADAGSAKGVVEIKFDSRAL